MNGRRRSYILWHILELLFDVDGVKPPSPHHHQHYHTKKGLFEVVENFNVFISRDK